jgi:hypothetical protein
VRVAVVALLKMRTDMFVSSGDNNNTVALVRERTIPTERPQLVGEVADTGDVACSAQRNPTAVISVF